LIGLFINTLPLRTDLSGDPTFRELLRRVRQTLLDAADHASLPFERLLSELDVPRDLSRNPIYQVVFNMRNVPRSSFRMDQLSIEPLVFDDGKAALDLSLEVTDTPDGYLLLFNYNCDLFDASTIDRMQCAFTTLLEGILNQPQAPLSSLPIMSAAEQAQILVQWNATDQPYPEQLGLHQIFEQKVADFPDAIALSMGSFHMTYAELNRRANRLAISLMGEGISANDIVAIAMERTPDLFIAILGILKAGGAFLALDLAHPAERLAYILADSQAKIVLADSVSMTKLDNLGSTRQILWQTPAMDEALNPAFPFGEAACVFYTSGSTGTPKGVLVSHRGVARYLCGIPPYDYTPEDTIAQISEASSDFITHELWGALLNGARLEIVPPRIAFSPAALVERIQTSGITVLLPPTGLVTLIAKTDPGAFTNLRELCFGGETADVESLRQIIRHGRPGLLINGFGPTEATTDATYYRIDQLDEHATNIPIGRPVPNTKIYIVSRDLTPVPMGVAGEILIGGPGVALGYLNRPEETAERFIPDRFSQKPGSYLFRTGDQGRYRPDGNMEFLGRLDQQVKVRGYRVEPAEIEAVLKQNTTVREAVVIYREGHHGKELVAYYTMNQDKPTAVDLRAYLKSRLPYFMLPSTFIPLERLPMTQNGKVDRLALSREALPYPLGAPILPHDPVEAKLVEIWKHVLNVDHLSLNDNFFELGGHSLLAIRLLTEIEKEFGCNLPLAALFEYSTVEEIARLIKSDPSARIWPLLIPIRPQGTRPPLFLMPGGGGGVFYLRELVAQLEKDRPVYGLQSIPPELRSRGWIPVAEQADKYIQEIRAIQPHGPYYLLGHSSGGIVVYEIACQLIRAGETVGLLGMLDTYPPGLRPMAPPGERLAIHWQNFLDSGSGEARVNYIKGRLQQLVARSIGKTPFLAAAARLGMIPEDRTTVATLIQDSYQPPHYEGTLTMFRVQDRRHYERDEPLLVWERYAQKVELINVPGNHRTLLNAPHVQRLARLLQEKLSTPEER
jgi:amino acid adenylation domain-containing protein